MDTMTLPRLGDLTRDQHRKMLGLEYMTWLSCLVEARIPASASRLFLQRYPHTVGATWVKKSLEVETKAAVSPGTTTDATWASPLVGPKEFEEGFVALVRGASVLGQIPDLRPVPFNIRIPLEEIGASFFWVAEGAPKPVSKMSFSNNILLGPTKGQAIVVLSKELVDLAGRGFPGALLNSLVDGLRAFVDKNFLDATLAAVPGKNPAGVIHGLTPIATTGDYLADVDSLLTTFYTARPGAKDARLIANAGHAAQLRRSYGGGGPGLPVLVSEFALGNTIAIDGSGLFLADNGVEIDQSDQASVQMSDAPDNPATASTVMLNLWQMNLRGLRVERFVNWQAVPGAVQYLAG